VEGSGPFVSLLSPVLDTYMDAAVGLTGCRSMSIERPSCEYDLLVVRPERNPAATLKIGDGYVDLLFSTERELMGPHSPEAAISLAFVKPIRDSGLVLSTCTSLARESLARNYQRGAEERLAASVKALGRATEAVSKGSEHDAGFWLATAGYDAAYAWLLASGVLPAPSHILSQLREVSRGQPGMFEAFSHAAGLQVASRATCESRLDALGVVFDVMEVPGSEGDSTSPESVRASYELLRSKALATLLSSQPVDSYCFLGLEAVRSLPHLLTKRPARGDTSKMVSSLSSEEDGLLAQSVIKSLGLARPLGVVERALDTLRNQVSELSRKTRTF